MAAKAYVSKASWAWPRPVRRHCNAPREPPEGDTTASFLLPEKRLEGFWSFCPSHPLIPADNGAIMQHPAPIQHHCDPLQPQRGRAVPPGTHTPGRSGRGTRRPRHLSHCSTWRGRRRRRHWQHLWAWREALSQWQNPRGGAPWSAQGMHPPLQLPPPPIRFKNKMCKQINDSLGYQGNLIT